MQTLIYKKKIQKTKMPKMAMHVGFVVLASQLATKKTDQRFKERILTQHQLAACTPVVDLGAPAAKLRRRDARKGASRAGRTAPHFLEPGRGTRPPRPAGLRHPVRDPGAREREWARGATGYVARGGLRWPLVCADAAGGAQRPREAKLVDYVYLLC